jgi:hypothetical protein
VPGVRSTLHESDAVPEMLVASTEWPLGSIRSKLWVGAESVMSNVYVPAGTVEADSVIRDALGLPAETPPVSVPSRL